jgi:hypothetical protein
MEKRQPLQQMLLGKLDICLQKTETRSMFITLYKYQSELRTLISDLKDSTGKTGNTLEVIGIGKERTSSVEHKLLSN